MRRCSQGCAIYLLKGSFPQEACTLHITDYCQDLWSRNSHGVQRLMAYCWLKLIGYAGFRPLARMFSAIRLLMRDMLIEGTLTANTTFSPETWCWWRVPVGLERVCVLRATARSWQLHGLVFMPFSPSSFFCFFVQMYVAGCTEESRLYVVRPFRAHTQNDVALGLILRLCAWKEGKRPSC